jgi:hypothetical protein
MASAIDPPEKPKSVAQVWAEGFVAQYKARLEAGDAAGLGALYVSLSRCRANRPPRLAPLSF